MNARKRQMAHARVDLEVWIGSDFFNAVMGQVACKVSTVLSSAFWVICSKKLQVMMSLFHTTHLPQL